MGRERITEVISGSSKDKVRVSALLKEFSAIPIHASDTLPEPPETFDKGVITGVTAYFFAQATPREVVSYYLQTLPPLGWRPSRDEFDGNEKKVKLCKSGVSLIVDASASKVGTKYYLGLVWTKFHHSSAYCAT